MGGGDVEEGGGGGGHLAEEGGYTIDDEEFRKDHAEHLKRVKQIEDSLLQLCR